MNAPFSLSFPRKRESNLDPPVKPEDDRRNNFKFRIKNFKELASTNSYLLNLPLKKTAEGLVVAADYQTQGRGKPGREWLSQPGKNLLFSLLIKPPIAPSKAPLLTQVACRCVAAVLKQQGIESQFKRPNDILVAGKKICGILVETGTSGARLDYVVIGVGLNVNASPEDLNGQAVSMKEISGRTFDRKTILKEILSQFERDLAPFYASARA